MLHCNHFVCKNVHNLLFKNHLKALLSDQLILVSIKYRTNLFGHRKRWDQKIVVTENVGRFDKSTNLTWSEI